MSAIGPRPEPRPTPAPAATATPTDGASPAAPDAAPQAGVVVPTRDAALKGAFPEGVREPLRSGARGERVVAVQYALGRLGHLDGLADGAFGPKTAAAVKAFQQKAGLPATGTVDAATLSALDQAAGTADFRTPAAKAASPLAYLSDWGAHTQVSKITVRNRSRPLTWAHPEIQAAYGKFVGEYWKVMKENRVEADCKTAALFLMDQFRSKVKADTGIQLPLPGSSEGRVPHSRWTAATAERPAGLMSRFEALAQVRPGYSVAQAIQKLDPKASMVQGVNVRYAGVSADAAARAAKTKWAWDPRAENRGDQSKPEVPVGDLVPGDIVFIDHAGDGKWDHTINVVGVERDAAGKPKRLTLAVGSFDDMKDADGATAPAGLHAGHTPRQTHEKRASEAPSASKPLQKHGFRASEGGVMRGPLALGRALLRRSAGHSGLRHGLLDPTARGAAEQTRTRSAGRPDASSSISAVAVRIWPLLPQPEEAGSRL